ncbi:ParA family protein [Staphylococcus agnetis]|uniref:ParA family protein n=1 Tax=Staphylococcus agnetis TaxID=985762 RepID=UPI00338E9B0D
MFDFDHQCNLSQVFDNDEQTNTVRGIFTGEDVEIRSVNDNIGLVSGYYFLDEVEEELKAGRDKYLYLYQWFGDNYSSIISNYDYIIIKTHPDFRAATRNAVVVSDIIISPDVPGANNKESLANLTVRFKNFQEKEHLLALCQRRLVKI